MFIHRKKKWPPPVSLWKIFRHQKQVFRVTKQNVPWLIPKFWKSQEVLEIPLSFFSVQGIWKEEGTTRVMLHTHVVKQVCWSKRIQSVIHRCKRSCGQRICARSRIFATTLMYCSAYTTFRQKKAMRNCYPVLRSLFTCGTVRGVNVHAMFDGAN